jgi:hypothetical protein
MERLTRRSANGTGVYATPSGEPIEWENNRHNVLQKLADYEDLEEQGRLVKLPCKIGDEVYNITWWDDVQEKVVVKGKAYCRTVHKHKVTKSTFTCFDINNFGKTVFLTKEEAEAKLKELRGKNE